jgi:hypothetical protein
MSDTGQGLPANVPGIPGYDPNALGFWWDAVANYGATSNVLRCPSTLNPPLLPPVQGAIGTANLPWVDFDTSDSQTVSGSFGCNGYLYDIINGYLDFQRRSFHTCFQNLHPSRNRLKPRSFSMKSV